MKIVTSNKLAEETGELEHQVIDNVLLQKFYELIVSSFPDYMLNNVRSHLLWLISTVLRLLQFRDDEWESQQYSYMSRGPHTNA